ncbi:MAG: membrane protein insertase YidC [Fimbriimonadia bacterium]|nr:membrane protein insertase YidC [Fimbriimonadia bacterium]
MSEQQPDQQKLFMRAMLISMVLWMFFLFMMPRFMNNQPAPAEPGAAAKIIQEAQNLRKEAQSLKNGNETYKAEEKLDESLSKLRQVTNQFKGTEDAAKATLLEAQIYGEDRKDFNQAYHTLKQLERFSSNTTVFKQEAKPYMREVGQKVDEHNSQFTTYKIINGIVSIFGRSDWSYVFAIILIAIVVRLVQIPIAHRQFGSMRKMLQVAPLLKELQENYKGEELARRQMAMYQKYGVNPFSSCLYALIPFPFLILVYNAIRLYEVNFEQGHFLWINPDMGARYPGYIGSHLGQFDAVLLGIYALSMYITSRLSVMDPSQAQQQKMMSLFTTVMLVMFSWQWGFPAAFTLYWLLSNVAYTVHYKLYMSKPAPELVPVEGGNRSNGKGFMAKWSEAMEKNVAEKQKLANGASTADKTNEEPEKPKSSFQPSSKKRKRK